MLDFINYPVSAILWFWHKVFGYVLEPSSGLAWALSVVFLVFTLRALLYKPFVHQVRSMKKMQEAAPLIRELQEKHKDDRQKLAQEMQKLQFEHGFNPVSGCLPLLVQAPVFFGLFQVLHGFTPNARSNYIFDGNEVSSFVQADLFGAKLSNTISQSSQELAAFGTNHVAMLTVGVPLMITAAVATHFTARHSVQRQTQDAASNPQAALMNRMTLWIFPMFAIIGGPVLPLAILIYWLANNMWTLAQQRVVYRKIDREEAAATGASPSSAPEVVQSSVVRRSDATEAGGGTEAGDTRTAASAEMATTETANAELASAEPVQPAETVTTEAVPSATTETALKDQPGEIPGVIEDRSRDTDKPDEAR